MFQLPTSFVSNSTLSFQNKKSIVVQCNTRGLWGDIWELQKSVIYLNTPECLREFLGWSRVCLRM